MGKVVGERERLPSFEVNELFAHKMRDSETPIVRYRQKEEMSRERIRLYSNHCNKRVASKMLVA